MTNSIKLINWVIKIAPIRACSLVWYTISNFDKNAFNNLSSFFLATTIATIIHSLINLSLIGKVFGNFNAYNYFFNVKEAIMISLVTASSSATLPISIKVAEDAGIKKKNIKFCITYWSNT